MELLKCLLCFPTWNIVSCILCMDFAMAMHVLLLKNTKGIFPMDLYPYHDQRVQHLEPGDHAQRIDFCHWIKAHPELLSVILFSDEASFTQDGVNSL